MEMVIEIFVDLVPMTLVIVIGVSLLGFLNRRMARKSAELAGEGTFRRQMTLTFSALVFIVAVMNPNAGPRASVCRWANGSRRCSARAR